MKVATLALLARPVAGADRGRVALIALAVAAAGALLLAGARIARVTGDPGSGDGLAPYVAESGLRPGVVIAALLLTVPVLALAVQALRVGSVARDRRMASLRLAGATARDVRWVSAAEGGLAGALGGVLAGPAYAVLWVALGVLPPDGYRFAPAPEALDVAAWALLAGLAALGGTLAGAAVQGRVVAEPLGVRRRAPAQAPGRANLVALLTGAGLIVAALIAFGSVRAHAAQELVVLCVVIAGLLVAAFAAGPRVVCLSGRFMRERGPVENLLAGRRLEADPGTAGRVAGVLIVCGVVLSVQATGLGQLLTGDSGDLDGFYLTGYAMAAASVLVAAAVALLTLLIGAADAMLDMRRPLATLAAVGVDERVMARVVARQLTATAVPAIALGAAAGYPVFAVLASRADGTHPLAALVLALVPAVLTALAAALGTALLTHLAARVLRGRIRAAIDPDNLRVA